MALLLGLRMQIRILKRSSEAYFPRYNTVVLNQLEGEQRYYLIYQFV
jgi:hypothetical protein